MSEWKVTSNYISGVEYYSVYRKIRKNELDHSGNREYAMGWTDDKSEAQRLADKLNNKG